MKNLNFHTYPRDFEADNLIENFLVSAVASLLVIRLFLSVTGYPQIGSGDFHIAHMLFGGLLMVFALLSLLVFLNKEVKYMASLVGGVGFGAFIDELGKFVTQDNDYFYEPAIAIIYVIFILIYLTSRAFEKFFKPTPEEYGINAIESVKSFVIHSLETNDKERALSLFTKSDLTNPILLELNNSLKKIKSFSRQNKPNLFHQIKQLSSALYLKIISFPLFIKTTVFSFVVISMLSFTGAIYNFSSAQTPARWGELIFSFISGLIVFMGIQVLLYKVSRMFAYELFKLAVLVSIFLTQYFRFLEDQLSAIFVLLLYLIVLSVLQYLIYEEQVLQDTKRSK